MVLTLEIFNMKVVIFLALFVLASAQLPGFIQNLLGWNSDLYHGWRFEYHRTHDLLLVRNSDSCYFVQGNKDIEHRFEGKDTQEALEKEIYDLITAHTGETKSTFSQLRSKYHDFRSVAECFGHRLFELSYTPASS